MSGLLEQYGNYDFSSIDLAEGNYFARIISQSKGIYRAITDEGELYCEIRGKLRYEAEDAEDLPAVGDYVILDRNTDANGNAIIQEILPRKSKFLRNASGAENQAQVVAANIDYALICTSLNNDFNLKRLERYITLAWNSGTTPVVVLTKADLCEDIDSKISAVESVAIGVEILLTSSIDEDGLEEIEAFLKKGETVALLGSSGVGKSTMVNRLLGKEAIETGAIREDDKGRHTTTQRQMFLLPNGSLLIDTPGMKEVGLLDSTDDFSQSFEDVEYFIGKCRFRDCTHTNEPGCAIFAAIANGELSEKRWNSYNRLRNENAYAIDKMGYQKKKEELLKERSERRKSVRNKKGH